MKRIGILFGQERSFPHALCARINDMKIDGVVAEPVLLGGVSLDMPKRYDLVLDRISQDIPFYRAALKKMAVDGTIVVNNPFWWSADDKFFNNVVARGVGVAVPKTILLPSANMPPNTTPESHSNLRYPLEWEEIFAQIGFPAYLKPYSGGGWKSVFKVRTPEEFFAAYHKAGDDILTLQEEIVFEEYYRCYAIGRKYFRVMPYDPRKNFFEMYVKEEKDMDPKMHERITSDIGKLVNALGYDFDTLEFAVRDGIPYAIDFLNCAPDADVVSVGEKNFEWVVETSAKWLVERVLEGQEPARDFTWKRFLAPMEGKVSSAPAPAAPAMAPASADAPKRSRTKDVVGSVETLAAPKKPGSRKK